MCKVLKLSVRMQLFFIAAFGSIKTESEVHVLHLGAGMVV